MARTMTGVVSSARGNKTIVVTVATRKTHPLYKKQYTFSKKFMAHDESNEANQGDTVVIAETRPLSARKRFILRDIVERAGVEHKGAADEAILEKPAESEESAE
ncbi:30S ribosomal protein S17 [Candidatus Saccharibacteria bacterium]|nr:MAG: 30S ribosomal protein S17 [Candidatus Saccharibacteria bacterium]